MTFYVCIIIVSHRSLDIAARMDGMGSKSGPEKSPPFNDLLRSGASRAKENPEDLGTGPEQFSSYNYSICTTIEY